jgi:hypothetical protein
MQEQLESARCGNACGWNAEKAELLAALDNAHLLSALASARQPATVPLGLVLLELAARDGGLATLILSRFLAQMPIADFGTAEQKERYASENNLLHGALCLTEPIPGAGAEALLLMGTYRPDGDTNGLWIEVEKRGRFTSHMEFADFVVAAVQGIDGASGSALVVLEPHDAGEFDRGVPAGKIGHRIASTTHPSFRLRVPAARIVGGYTIRGGILQPNFNHRQLLEPALCRARALLALMTAAKALAVTSDFFSARACDSPEFWLEIADLWATAEAAASLGFSAARLCDEPDSEGAPDHAAASNSNLFSSAAKLFASTRIIPALSRVAAVAGANPVELRRYIVDAQVEAVYMGPDASQRRLISAAMTTETFAAMASAWIENLQDRRHNTSAAKILTTGFKLWSSTLGLLRSEASSGSEGAFHSLRQAAGFAMADSLCGLLAARSLLLDSAELEVSTPDANAGVVEDLVHLASAHAVSHAVQTSISLISGGSTAASPGKSLRREWATLRAEACASLTGFQYARERIAQVLANHARTTELT